MRQGGSDILYAYLYTEEEIIQMMGTTEMVRVLIFDGQYPDETLEVFVKKGESIINSVDPLEWNYWIMTKESTSGERFKDFENNASAVYIMSGEDYVLFDLTTNIMEDTSLYFNMGD